MKPLVTNIKVFLEVNPEQRDPDIESEILSVIFSYRYFDCTGALDVREATLLLDIIKSLRYTKFDAFSKFSVDCFVQGKKCLISRLEKKLDEIYSHPSLSVMCL